MFWAKTVWNQKESKANFFLTLFQTTLGYVYVILFFFALRDQPLVVPKMTSKAAHLNNFFSIGWVLILFMVDGEHITFLWKKGKKPFFLACTLFFTLFCTSRKKIFPQNFGWNFLKIIKFWRDQANNVILVSWRYFWP